VLQCKIVSHFQLKFRRMLVLTSPRACSMHSVN